MLADRLFLLLGLGHHVDRLVVRDPDRRVFSNVQRLFFYEDLPYAFRLEEEQISFIAAGLTKWWNGRALLDSFPKFQAPFAANLVRLNLWRSMGIACYVEGAVLGMTPSQ